MEYEPNQAEEPLELEIKSGDNIRNIITNMLNIVGVGNQKDQVVHFVFSDADVTIDSSTIRQLAAKDIDFDLIGDMIVKKVGSGAILRPEDFLKLIDEKVTK